MPSTLLLTPKAHAPRARCHECGSPEIASVCHHCGTGMCQRHTRPAYDTAQNPVSREFVTAGLEPRHAGAMHCPEHAHVVRGRPVALVVLAVVLAVACLLAALASIVVGLLLFLVGAGLGVAAYLLDQQRQHDILAARPPLPVLPSRDSISVLETFRGLVRLGQDGRYTSTPEPVKGTAEFVMTLGKADRTRLASYRAKYKMGDEDPVSFAAGFSVCWLGEARLMFTPAPELEKLALPGGTSIAFRGAMAGDPLFSRVPSGRPTGQWAVRLPYGLDETRKPGSVPVWLVPFLVPASDKRTLEVDLHWVALDEGRPGQKRRELALDRFELIELVGRRQAGETWRGRTRLLFTRNPKSAAVRTIQWKQLPPGRQPGSHNSTVRFEKQINLHDKLTGSLQALFRGTLSGITDVAMYRPTGAGWLQPPKSNVKKMEASVDFELSLKLCPLPGRPGRAERSEEGRGPARYRHLLRRDSRSRDGCRADERAERVWLLRQAGYREPAPPRRAGGHGEPVLGHRRPPPVSTESSRLTST